MKIEISRVPASNASILCANAAAVILTACGAGMGVQGVRDCADCPDLVAISPGTFLMGSTKAETDAEGTREDQANSEKPRHRVTITNGFLAGKYEVTVGEYAEFVENSGYAVDGDCAYFTGTDWVVGADLTWENPGFRQTDQHPVVCVSWHDARAFAAWLSKKTGKSYRLPSESEWEYLARAGTESVRFWGDSIGEKACRYASVRDTDTMSHYKWDLDTQFLCSDGYVATGPVDRGTVEPNAFGLIDTLGNVWEWVEDCFHDSYANAPVDGRVWATDNCKRNVFRGGSWFSSPDYLRPAFRDVQPPTTRADNIGFRIVRDHD